MEHLIPIDVTGSAGLSSSECRVDHPKKTGCYQVASKGVAGVSTQRLAEMTGNTPKETSWKRNSSAHLSGVLKPGNAPASGPPEGSRKAILRWRVGADDLDTAFETRWLWSHPDKRMTMMTRRKVGCGAADAPLYYVDNNKGNQLYLRKEKGVSGTKPWMVDSIEV
eukprot:GHVN01025083.1.p1 GENE.GHVN01025083.1~~GHVN01025083.1.p1  ORF type:complete len:166 (-),score=13.58 GHVN01025083.1:567-1064(-)